MAVAMTTARTADHLAMTMTVVPLAHALAASNGLNEALRLLGLDGLAHRSSLRTGDHEPGAKDGGCDRQSETLHSVSPFWLTSPRGRRPRLGSLLRKASQHECRMNRSRCTAIHFQQMQRPERFRPGQRIAQPHRSVMMVVVTVTPVVVMMVVVMPVTPAPPPVMVVMPMAPMPVPTMAVTMSNRLDQAFGRSRRSGDLLHRSGNSRRRHHRAQEHSSSEHETFHSCLPLLFRACRPRTTQTAASSPSGARSAEPHVNARRCG
jgi:hypothetical protein